MKVTKTYFMLMVADMDRAVRFYHDVFGLPIRMQSPDWSELGSADGVVALHGGAKREPRDTGLGFDVDDLEAACAAVTRGGGTVVRPPQTRPGEPIRLATVEDSEQNRLTLATPAPR